MVKTLNAFQQWLYSLVGWKGFSLPVGEKINCWKDRSRVVDSMINAQATVFWWTNITNSRLQDPGKIPSNGVGAGTPMQLGRSETRVVTWGSGYGRYNQWKAVVPLPLLGNRYWITGYPVPQYDKRCIIMGPDGVASDPVSITKKW